jgi:hypothetical protein
MRPSNLPSVLNKIPVTQWVLDTATKMQAAGTKEVSDWNRFWLQTYQALGGESDESGSKGCPRAGAYALWFLGRLRAGKRPLQPMTVARINEVLGKNAAYVVIAADLLEGGAPESLDSLWESVRAQYKMHTGEEPAESEQGEIRLVVALFRERQLAATRALS